MDLRTQVCFALSRRLIRRPPSTRTVEYTRYQEWRTETLSSGWHAFFSDAAVNGKDVLDFGCGDGQLSLFLATNKRPKRVVGVDINEKAIARARSALEKKNVANTVAVEFLVGSREVLPVGERSFDTVLAFDCMEHVMSPGPILRDWYRVLRLGGRCLIEWVPFKGPWGPHMDDVIPIPWAHVVFGERALFQAAAMIYDLPEFVPRYWDIDEHGRKKPNDLRTLPTFKERGYINQLDIGSFFRLAAEAGFQISRFERHSFGGPAWRRFLGHGLMSLPLVGEYFISYVIIELLRPK